LDHRTRRSSLPRVRSFSTSAMISLSVGLLMIGVIERAGKEFEPLRACRRRLWGRTKDHAAVRAALPLRGGLTMR
jgi:hypothetical protein